MTYNFATIQYLTSSSTGWPDGWYYVGYQKPVSQAIAIADVPWDVGYATLLLTETAEEMATLPADIVARVSTLRFVQDFASDITIEAPQAASMTTINLDGLSVMNVTAQGEDVTIEVMDDQSQSRTIVVEQAAASFQFQFGSGRVMTAEQLRSAYQVVVVEVPDVIDLDALDHNYADYSALRKDLTLKSGATNDTLITGVGNDTLLSGGGKDTLTGGEGADTFVIDANPKQSSFDVITDFDLAVDKVRIDLEGEADFANRRDFFDNTKFSSFTSDYDNDGVVETTLLYQAANGGYDMVLAFEDLDGVLTLNNFEFV